MKKLSESDNELIEEKLTAPKFQDAVAILHRCLISFPKQRRGFRNTYEISQ